MRALNRTAGFFRWRQAPRKNRCGRLGKCSAIRVSGEIAVHGLRYTRNTQSKGTLLRRPEGSSSTIDIAPPGASRDRTSLDSARERNIRTVRPDGERVALHVTWKIFTARTTKINRAATTPLHGSRTLLPGSERLAAFVDGLQKDLRPGSVRLQGHLVASNLSSKTIQKHQDDPIWRTPFCTTVGEIRRFLVEMHR